MVFGFLVGFLRGVSGCIGCVRFLGKFLEWLLCAQTGFLACNIAYLEVFWLLPEFSCVTNLLERSLCEVCSSLQATLAHNAKGRIVFWSPCLFPALLSRGPLPALAHSASLPWSQDGGQSPRERKTMIGTRASGARDGQGQSQGQVQSQDQDQGQGRGQS